MKVVEFNKVVQAMASKYPTYQKVADELEKDAFDTNELTLPENPRVTELEEELNKTIDEANKKLKALTDENDFLKDTIVRMAARLTH